MIKSKERIADFGEVFTSEREVTAMLDLVKVETDRIESRFLEPACGDGNFLIEVLRRKLLLVRKQYLKSQADFEKYAFLATSSIYGIDLLEDNVSDCRERICSSVIEVYRHSFTKSACNKFIQAIRFVVHKNILLGDALTLTLPESKQPIIFSEWCFINDTKVKRTDYALNNLIACQPFEEDNLFSDLGEEAFIPAPLRAFKPILFKDVHLA